MPVGVPLLGSVAAGLLEHGGDLLAGRLFRNETSLLARVMREGKHPGIVQLLDTFLGADPPFLKFELIEGGDLVAVIRRWHQHPGGPSVERATRTLLRLA